VLGAGLLAFAAFVGFDLFSTRRSITATELADRSTTGNW
jgi:hypothetical protein